MDTDAPFDDQLLAALDRLANLDRVRSEATVQADIRQLLLTGGLGLAEHDLEVDLETPVTGQRRIDIEVGFTVIEVKKDLRRAAVVRQAEKQLAGYVTDRSEHTGQRYVGILTDGAVWRAYHSRGGELTEATRFELKPGRPVGVQWRVSGGHWKTGPGCGAAMAISRAARILESFDTAGAVAMSAWLNHWT